ncbi:MAG: sugar nucleotide-binding protein [Lachnospiraceae bacterium]|nr:sugar nucleotide-binding protein [Lachnospiraceae bacterium]
MKKIVITGGSGFVGSRFKQMWKSKYDILALSSKDLDVTSQEAIDIFMDQEKPDYVIHAAGLANQQFCIDHPEKAYAVNVSGALYMAKACKRVGAKMIFTSTEQLFNGSSEPGPYTEESTPVPDTVYGKNKWEVEQKLPAIFSDYWIVRFTWIFGLPEKDCAAGSNILWDTIQSILKNKPITTSEYEFRGMTDVDEICVNLEKLFSLPYGTYHFGSTNNNGRYEIVRFIMEKLGLAENRIQELLIADNSKFNAENPRELRLDNTKAAEAGLTFLDTKDGIENCLRRFSIIK